MPQKGEDWGEEQIVILYERLLVPGHPWSLLPLDEPWELLVYVFLSQPWKWLPFIDRVHPWKLVQGSVLEMVLATVRLVWVGLILRWKGLFDMNQLFSSLKIFH